MLKSERSSVTVIVRSFLLPLSLVTKADAKGVLALPTIAQLSSLVSVLYVVLWGRTTVSNVNSAAAL